MKETTRKVFEFLDGEQCLNEEDFEPGVVRIFAAGGAVVSTVDDDAPLRRSPQQARDYARALVAIADEIDPPKVVGFVSFGEVYRGDLAWLKTPRAKPEPVTCRAEELQVGQRYRLSAAGYGHLYVRLAEESSLGSAQIDMGRDAHEFVPVLDLTTYEVSRCAKFFHVYPEPV